MKENQVSKNDMKRPFLTWKEFRQRLRWRNIRQWMKTNRKNLLEKGMAALFFVAACASILAVALICIFIFQGGYEAISQIGLFEFLGGTRWKPTADPPSFGIFPMIMGSIYVTGGAILIGVPIGILSAIFMARFCPKRLYRWLKPAFELLAGIPSIVYGFFGLMVGYVIYTIPVAFLLIHNTMGFVDKKTLTVSKVMGDKALSTFWIAVLRPLLGTFAGAFIQAFFLCFTDFGIPASVGGGYEVIATLLYNQMLGGIPDFNRGAVIAMVMLIPSIGSICILQILERFNIRYSRISNADLRKNSLRDVGWGLSGTVISAGILAIFAVIFVVPTVEEWPYQTEFSLEHFQTVLSDSSLLAAYGHSLLMALLTAAAGTLIAYGAALITARSNLGRGYKRTIESIALVTNAIPGMVLGVAYLFLFSGTSLQNTLLLMVLCNIVHYFSTPYLMMKNALSKMNAGWETTAMLMGDSWLKTILRVVTPNALSSLIEVFSYYFINSMVTISALIFIAGARTMVLTTMIKQLQYVNRFNEVFVLSLLILATNLAAKALFSWLAGYRSKHSPKITKKEGIK